MASAAAAVASHAAATPAGAAPAKADASLSPQRAPALSHSSAQSDVHGGSSAARRWPRRRGRARWRR